MVSNIPDNWEIKSLDEIIQIIGGGTPKTTVREYWDGDIPWVSIEDIADANRYIYSTKKKVSSLGLKNSSTKLIPAGSIVISARGTVGAIAQLAYDMSFNQSCYGLIAKKVVNENFLFYLLKHSIEAIKSNTHGSVFDTITKDTFRIIKVVLPPINEQNAIADILGSLDDKIELNHQMNTTLEAMSFAIFKSWFVNFDPVRTKMEGRDPYGIDAETAALFPDSFEDSVLGNIPQGWKVKSIGEVVKVVGGTTPSTKDSAYWEGGNIHWATPKDLASLSNLVLLDTERCITDLGLQQIGSGLLPEGTVLLSSRAPIGYLAISKMPVAINQGFIAIICDEIIPNHYILYWLKENMGVIEGRANGTTFQEISKANFRPIPIVIPPESILQRFNEHIDGLHRQVVNNLEQSHTLSTIRDTLLPKLVSGEVSLKDIENPLHDYSSTKEKITWKF